MREFYYKDIKTNVAFRGFIPTTEKDCPPFEYFRLALANHIANYLQDVPSIKCSIPIPSEQVRVFALRKTDEVIAQMLLKSAPHHALHNLLMDDTLSHKQRERLLKGITLTPKDILWLNKEAQEMGYLLDIYYEEKYPEKFNKKIHPLLFCQKKDGTIEKMGLTDMTEGEMRALLEQRKVIQARVYHKKSTWHCFYFTFKGLAGEESGLAGSKPHYHYLSDRSGIAWDELMDRIKDCDMPSSRVHIMIERKSVTNII